MNDMMNRVMNIKTSIHTILSESPAMMAIIRKIIANHSNPPPKAIVYTS